MPLVEIPPAIEARLAELGGKPVNLYRALANNPDQLAAWIEFAWSVRQKPVTARRLRELMIVRGASLMRCDYELAHHRVMALRCGVSEEELEALDRWRETALFAPQERAALAFMEAMVEGAVPDAVNAELARHFDASERVELALTGGLYCMVPRVLDALRVPLDTDGTGSPEG
ncbi:MAG: carboxymuconolactone decarboxylase family protein [Candidatus Dormibacteraeota bacterium]|nr:carboxymuconolactone decarboxylase family protein [Candidatus Dormibacteraeota bacterium]